MKSKTLSSNFTIFKKDITRFSPIWLLWCGMFLIMGYLTVNSGMDITLSDFPNMFTWVNLIYGICCAVVLFGYLSDPKECIMVHSLPIRRENLFFIHLLAGLTMHIIPTALFCLCMISSCEGSIFAMFALMVMQFVFFYGLGIFCMMLTGRKFAAVVLYGLINVAAPLILFAVNTLYIPLLPGIELRRNPFLQFCPVMSMIYQDTFRFEFWSFTSNLTAYLRHVAIFAAIGVGLMLVSLVLYRCRKLECAENFMAFPKLNFIFVPVCTIFCGCFFTIFSFGFGLNSYWFLLGLGGVISYVASMMLLRHSPKVFDPKSLGGFALIAALVAGSLFVVKMDPMGLTSRIPDADSVVRAELYTYELNEDCYFTEDPEQIAKLLELHKKLLNQEPTENTQHVELLYHMKDGSTMKRVYEASEPLHPQISWYLSQPEYMLHASTEDQVLTQYKTATLYVGHDLYQLTQQEQEEVLRALFADCKDGTLNFNPSASYELQSHNYTIELTRVYGDSDLYHYESFSVYPKNVQTYGWITQYLKNHNITE